MGFLFRTYDAESSPRNARCDGCAEPIAEKHGRGSNRWVRGPRMDTKPSDYPLGGRNDDGSNNVGGERCKGTDGETGKHKPRDGSIW